MARQPPRLRLARMQDADELPALIARSARALSAGDYTPSQIEAALLGAWGLDTQLIVDGTYFVGEADAGLVACGGWSFRETAFGGDAYRDREPRRLDPAREAARIRAFFVDPAWSRQGLGRALLARCESAARAAGFIRAELTATLPGQRLYAAHGYRSETPRAYPLPSGETIVFVAMHKNLV